MYCCSMLFAKKFLSLYLIFLFIISEELGQGINTDEAAALGAVYQAAYLSKGFRVKKFIIKEATVYPIQVGGLSFGLRHNSGGMEN